MGGYENVFQARDVTVGWTGGNAGYGYKVPLPVTVTVEIRRREGKRQTTAHETVSDPLEFSMCVDVWKPGRGDIVAGGQHIEGLSEIKRYARGWDEAKVAELVAIHAEWHLNTMKAGCDHQTVVYERDRYGRKVASLDLTPPCPETGYRYGHGWLTRPLPGEVVTRVRQLFG